MRLPTVAAFVLGFAVLTIAMTWPLLSPAAGVLPNSDDAYFSVWRLAWVAHQLPRDPPHLFDANIFHPATGALAFSDAMLLVSAIGAPAIWLGVSAPFVHNLLIAGGIVSSMWLTFLLVRDLTHVRAAAWVAAIIFGFAPYRIAHIGHLELQWTMFMPLSLWLLNRYVAAPTAGRALAVGAAVAGQLLCSIYYGVFLALYLGVAAIILLVWHRPQRRGAALFMPLTAIPLIAAAAIYAQPYSQARRQFGPRSASEITAFSAAPADFLRVPPDNRLRGTPDPQPAYDERSLFPGTTTLVLAAIAFVPPVAPPAWMYLGLTAFSVDAALGMNGILFPVLHQLAPPLTSFRAPARFAVLVLLSLAVLAGYGAAKVMSARPRHRTVFAGAITLLCLVEFWSAPIAVRVNQSPPTAAHRWLSGQSAGTVIVEMPVPRGEALWLYETTYLIRSIHHWQPLVNGYSGFAPGEYLKTLESLREFPDQRSVDRLRELGVRFVLLNRAYYGGEEFAALIGKLTASPAFSPSRSLGDGDDEIVIVEMTSAPQTATAVKTTRQ